MPIKWVLYWQANQGATVNTQILAEVSQCIESINGVKGGRWKSTLTYYKPIQRDQTMQLPAEITKDMMGISLQEQPNKYYFFIRSQRIVLEAESMIQTIMEKLQSYRSRISANFESGFLWMLFNVFEEACVCKAAPDILKALSELKGFQYQFGDFQVRVGKIVPINSDILRGIVMEIEYLPISSLEKSRQVMEDFVDMWKEIVSKRSLPGKFEQVEPNFAEYGLPDRYSSQHTVIQYAMVMNQLLAPVRN